MILDNKDEKSVEGLGEPTVKEKEEAQKVVPVQSSMGDIVFYKSQVVSPLMHNGTTYAKDDLFICKDKEVVKNLTETGVLIPYVEKLSPEVIKNSLFKTSKIVKKQV